MSTTEFSANAVYSGFWVDHHYGSATGLTLTLSSSSSVYLIAFLALFVRVSGNHCWNLCCYLIFRFRSRSHPRDGLYHQKQILLRAEISDIKSAVALFKLGRAWNGKASRPLARVIPLALLAVFHVLTFAICGIFSSKVTQAHSSVLLRNGTCGEYVINYEDDASINELIIASGSNQVSGAAFTERCYNFNSTDTSISSPGCDAPGRQRVQWTIDEVQCPFQSRICRGRSAVRFDTGYMDSNDHLGVNGPINHRVLFRNVCTHFCCQE